MCLNEIRSSGMNGDGMGVEWVRLMGRKAGVETSKKREHVQFSRHRIWCVNKVESRVLVGLQKIQV